MSLPDRVLCVTFTYDGPAAHIGLVDGRLKYLGGMPGARESVESLIEDLEAKGVHICVERPGKRMIEVGFNKVSAEHPRFLGAAAHTFRERGWWAQTMTRERAEIWHDLVRLPIEHDEKKDIMHRLTFVEGKALDELRTVLAQAVREFEKASR
jgi:hypothetical protein